ncbi:hypothetical protein [Chitinophaga sp.]|uniref:hypothetical protein n=1 Tax=Chitinophaga sp. TaxID=1869181 RepID=UPI0031D7D64B
MKKIKLSVSIVGALLGITGAYATTRHTSAKYSGPMYNWYLSNGELAFSATIEVAKSMCLAGFATVCLRGTAEAIQIPTVVLKRQ